MKIILEPNTTNPNFDFYNRNADYTRFQDDLGMDDNFDLVDSIIYAMDYGELSKDGKIHDVHNGINITIEP